MCYNKTVLCAMGKQAPLRVFMRVVSEEVNGTEQ
jgi:hypothetical protein